MQGSRYIFKRMRVDIVSTIGDRARDFTTHAVIASKSVPHLNRIDTKTRKPLNDVSPKLNSKPSRCWLKNTRKDFREFIRSPSTYRPYRRHNFFHNTNRGVISRLSRRIGEFPHPVINKGLSIIFRRTPIPGTLVIAAPPSPM